MADQWRSRGSSNLLNVASFDGNLAYQFIKDKKKKAKNEIKANKKTTNKQEKIINTVLSNLPAL